MPSNAQFMTIVTHSEAKAGVPLDEGSKEAPKGPSTIAAGTLESQAQWSLRAWKVTLGRVPAGGALLSIDVDGFVHVNNVLQRRESDQTRRDCAELLKEFLPADSLASHWRRGRVMVYMRNASKALEVSEQVRQAVEGAWSREHTRIRQPSWNGNGCFTEPLLTISIGVAAYDGNVVRSTRAANAACSDAKRRGLNQVVAPRALDGSEDGPQGQ
jgi:GGDEF domain-containing protein